MNVSQTVFCSMVITELPPDHAKKALEALCLPVVTSLQVSNGLWRYSIILYLIDNTQTCDVIKQEVVNQDHEILDKKVAREFTVHIDRFAYIFRYDWSFSVYTLYFPWSIVGMILAMK